MCGSSRPTSRIGFLITNASTADSVPTAYRHAYGGYGSGVGRPTEPFRVGGNRPDYRKNTTPRSHPLLPRPKLSAGFSGQTLGGSQRIGHSCNIFHITGVVQLL